MNIAREAENYIKQYFKDKKNIELIKPNKGEIGFDFRDRDSKIFIEAKGTSKSKLSDVMFRMFTNAECWYLPTTRKLEKFKLSY